MNLPHKIVFACDNGDVDVLSKKIPEEIIEVEKELSELTTQIQKIEIQNEEDKLYKSELDLILSKTNDEIRNYKQMNLYNSTENKISRKLKDICQRTAMLHEKINSFKILKELSKISDFREKKWFVDNLYKSKENSNKVYENVKALLSNDEGRTWETVQKIFTDLNYSWKYKVLNAKDYGIPQNRERVFVVGFRNDLKLKKTFEFPQPIKLKRKMQDFLLDNAPGGYFLPKKGVDFVTAEKNLTKKYTQIDGEIQLCQKKNQQFNWHGDFVFQSEEDASKKIKTDLEKYFLSDKVRKYVLATGTKGFYSRPKIDLEVARPLLTTMHKMHRAGVDNYVTTDGRLRKLTPRECFRLMGFYDDFIIPVSDTSAYQQAGNSIVVDVLIHIMNSILESYPNLAEGNK